MRKPPDHTPEDRRRRGVRRSQRRSRRRGQSGGATDAGNFARTGSRRGAAVVLQPIPVTPESAALDRFRGRAAPLADRKALQAPAARPLLGRQEIAHRVSTGAEMTACLRKVSCMPICNSGTRKSKPAVFSLPRRKLCTITAFSETQSASSKGVKKMREAVIVSYARTGLAKSGRGGFNITPPMSMAAHAIKHAVDRAKVDKDYVEDCYLGNCAHLSPNIGRQAALLAGMPKSTAGVSVNRFCSSGLQTIAMAANSIRSDGADCIVAGGGGGISGGGGGVAQEGGGAG